MSIYENITPDVEAILGDGNQRQHERQLTEGERAALRRHRERERAREEAKHKKRLYDLQRNKKAYDLPISITDELTALGKRYEVSASGMASLALWMGLKAIQIGEIDVTDFRYVIDSPRFSYEIIIPEE